MFTQLINYFIPERIKACREDYFRAKNILGGVIIAATSAPFFAFFYYFFGAAAAALVILLEGTCIVGAAFILKNSGSVFWARELIVGSLALSLFWLGYTTGGIFAPATFWLALPPITAFFFGGIKSGIFSACVCSIAVILIYVLGFFALSTPSLAIAHSPHLDIISILGLLFIILCLAYFYDKRALEFIKSLEDALNKEKVITKKLEMRTRSLQDQKAVTEIERSSKNLLHNVLESSREYSIIATTSTGDILIWNKGAFYNYGYTAEEVVGKANIEILHTREYVESGQYKRFLEKVNMEREAEEIIEQVRKDGSHFIASVVMTIRKDDEGVPIGYLNISHNITQQKRLEEQLIKINKELEQFAYIVSHDLKAPLRAIELLSTWIEEDSGNKLDEQGRKNFALLRSRVIRMSNLISGVLGYSRVGYTEKKIQTVNTRDLIKGTIETLDPAKSFTIHYAEHLPTVYADEIQLSQIFSNLIDNSMKHHHKKTGNIEIDAKEIDDFYEFSIKDDGPGIESEYHEKIFTIFQTLRGRDEFESTGVGLTIVKKIIELNGGKIRVYSELGKGTTFYFTWPKKPKNSE
ncbi:ATP-binding protein [Legionella cherrii]|uniref:histidine kinase n=1 Tax=Legionella cherrii TaxID=28084 RepID=A0A0W0SBF5_9GAMM|nr:ATP-binding protein [Legionella cherrii]KTC80892.1 sensory box histidine kinase [Legionella cherrii]VEB34100.1 sensory box histidine kinase [Legionella cherrii]